MEAVYSSETLATQHNFKWGHYTPPPPPKKKKKGSVLTMNDCEILKSAVFFIHAATKDLFYHALLFMRL
jgi:hypothetical protein